MTDETKTRYTIERHGALHGVFASMKDAVEAGKAKWPAEKLDEDWELRPIAPMDQP